MINSGCNNFFYTFLHTTVETNNYPPLWSDLSSIISKSSSSSGISSESTFLVVVVWVELDIVKSVSEDHKYWAPLSLSSSPYGIPSLWILLRPKKSFQNYTQSLAPANFSGAVFTDVQLDEYETAPCFFQFSQNLTWDSLLISVFCLKFTWAQPKIVLYWCSKQFSAELR